jgi:2-dehydropantoate 2-reductase
MRVAVMGTGGVGGYFGTRLALGGCDVSFIARGRHLEMIRQGGLKVESPLGDMRLATPRATNDPAEIGPVDLVLFGVKLWDTETWAERSSLSHSGEVLSLAFSPDSKSLAAGGWDKVIKLYRLE